MIFPHFSKYYFEFQNTKGNTLHRYSSSIFLVFSAAWYWGLYTVFIMTLFALLSLLCMQNLGCNCLPAPLPHWPNFGWDVSELCLQRVHFCRKVEIVAIDTDKNSFLMTILIELTLGNIFTEVKKSARVAPLSQNSWYIFQMQITPLLRCP